MEQPAACVFTVNLSLFHSNSFNFNLLFFLKPALVHNEIELQLANFFFIFALIIEKKQLGKAATNQHQPLDYALPKCICFFCLRKIFVLVDHYGHSPVFPLKYSIFCPISGTFIAFYTALDLLNVEGGF